MRMLSHLITKRGIAFVKRRYDSPAAAVTHWEHFGMEPIVVGHGFTFRPPYRVKTISIAIMSSL
ncbi:hypothetical protein N8964_01665 [Pontimonas sp.]|nr:hypothetical protein [Pontimonas sp.]